MLLYLLGSQHRALRAHLRLKLIGGLSAAFSFLEFSKNNKLNNFADLMIFFVDFEKTNFLKSIFKIQITHKPFLGSCEVPQKNCAGSVQPFWYNWDTIGRQAKLHRWLRYLNTAQFIQPLFLCVQVGCKLPLSIL